jgi:ubiquinone/menaquinone biosynthesis C-methylase UbiE
MDSEGAAEEHKRMADFYDVLFAERTIDIPFWEELAKQLGSPLLEFACGTGRLTFPMARAGMDIVGIDVSEAMLAKAYINLQKEEVAVQKRMTFLKAEISSFDIKRKFSAILSPWGFHAVSKEEQDQCLRQVKKHLLPGGHFVVDTENIRDLEENLTYHKLLAVSEVPSEDFTIVRQEYMTWSAATKTVNKIFFVDKIKTDGTMKRFIARRTERVYTNSYMQDLLREHGFVIETMYGFYDFRPYEDAHSERSIIVASLF